MVPGPVYKMVPGPVVKTGPDPIDLEGGGSLSEIEIAYHVTPGSAEGRKVVWICHALTANSNPQEWWDTLVGPGKFLDTESYYIVCANILTSCYGSTGPQSVDPATGRPYLFSFPTVSIRDMVNAHELLRRELGIEKIDLLIGGSSGGFQCVEWAISNPGLIKNLCLIACNARFSAWGTALNESQRMALMADPTFASGNDVRGGEAGLACARSIALLSYRSYEGYVKTQSENEEDCFMASRACSYQQYQGKKLADRFNAYSYYYLTLSLDTHNVGRGRGGVERALSLIEANTLCVAIDSDLLFPRQEIEFMAANIPSAKFEVIDSDWGHDGFLLEYEKLERIIKKHIEL